MGMMPLLAELWALVVPVATKRSLRWSWGKTFEIGASQGQSNLVKPKMTKTRMEDGGWRGVKGRRDASCGAGRFGSAECGVGRGSAMAAFVRVRPLILRFF